jgi:putative multiple sugar transport system ATP-binding protein
MVIAALTLTAVADSDRYDPVLTGVTLSVAAGEIVGLIGENGSGSNAVVELLGGNRPKRSSIGTVEVSGSVVSVRTPAESTAAGIRVIRRSSGLSPNLSLAGNILLGRELRRAGFISWPRTNAAAADYLAAVGMVAPAAQLSGDLGPVDRLRVESAKAIAGHATVLVFDDPTGGRSEAEIDQIGDLFRRLAARGLAVLVSTSRVRDLLGLCTTAVVLRDGRTVARVSAAATSADDIVPLLASTDPVARVVPRGKAVGRELLSVEHWTVYDALNPTEAVIADASFLVRSGEIVGLAGINDVSRNTLLLSVYGRSAGVNAAGVVRRDGDEIVTGTVEKSLAHGLFFVGSDSTRYEVTTIGGVTMPVAPSTLARLAKTGIIDRNRDYRPVGADRPTGGGPSWLSRLGPQSDNTIDRVSALSERHRLYSLCAAITAAGKSIVWISDETTELFELCDRIYGFADCRVTGELRTDDSVPADLMRLIVPTADPGAEER